MSLKSKKKAYKFTFKSLIRLVIFALIIYLAITFLASQKFHQEEANDPTVLGTEIASDSAQIKVETNLNSLYQKIPANSRQKIETLNTNPTVVFVQDKFNQLKSQANGFPDKQIKEIKKAVVKSVYDDMIKSIDGSK